MNATSDKSRGSTPLSAHPVFPAIIALWFAALMGIGTLIVPNALFEQLSTASGLSAIVPEAAPPLGFKAKLLIALAFALLGAITGLFLGLKVARMQRPRRVRQRAVSTQPKRTVPLDARRDLGEAFDAPQVGRPPETARRRALTVGSEEGLSELLQAPPAPVTVPEADDALILFDQAPLPRMVDESASAPSAADRRSRQMFQPAEPEPPAPIAQFIVEEAAPAAEFEEDEAEAPTPFAELQAAMGKVTVADEGEEPSDPAPRQVFQPPMAEEAADAGPFVVESDDENDESEEEVISFAAPSLARQVFQPTAAEESASDSLESPAEEEPLPDWEQQDDLELNVDDEVHEAPVSPVTAATVTARPVTERDLGTLGTVELAERLAIAMTRRNRATQGQTVRQEPTEFTPAAPIDAARSEPQPQAGLRFAQSRVADVPKALRPFDAANIDEPADEEPLDLTLSDHVAAHSAPNFASFRTSFTLQDHISHDPDSDEDEDETYSSLLAMRPQPRVVTEHIRIEDEPVSDDSGEPAVTFPGQAPRSAASASRLFDRPVDVSAPTGAENSAGSIPQLNPENVPARTQLESSEAERQLRSALATLQKVSGVA
ncbi:hypothetical protein ACXYN8_09830 [Altererythrobacter sp. CAU 1778]